MPIDIAKKIKFNPLGGSIKVNFIFKSLLLCTYTFDVTEAGSNASQQDYPKKGDNSNLEDDSYVLPMPAHLNKDRRLWGYITIIDQTGDRGKYEVAFEISQDGKQLDLLSTGPKEIKADHAEHNFVAQLIS